ncbi:Arf-GAP domain and FG repeat-containing protein 2 [Phytophthora boehmeriae]|uniref:Arf-GAP domain and FG repeat-containing protein 2 n=1 Tax=Phytophthora boehmeriae TaxID=109152 RepID=A0A8T1X557_9STRA|nr:Arf-GAP domain and FG repeat-containing protein 2 [Phytophthora boehmeriae]
MSAAEAEVALNALKKLEANKTCVNCGNYNRFGHQNICEKVKTFVCSNCKSAHQSYSMRVKSVSMSNWTMDEVDALKEQNGGGNAVAGRVWLGLWDEGQMRKPTKDDPLDYYKQFINRVYNDKAFYDESGFNGSSRQAASSPAAAAAPVNLLDFDGPSQQKASSGSFDAFSGGSNDGWGNFAAAPQSTPSVSSDDGFGSFAAAPAPANGGFADFSAAPASAPASGAGSEAFGAFTAAPQAPAPSSSSFDPFAASTGDVFAPTPMSNGNGSAAFDPFASVPNQNQPKSNIMSQFNAPPAPKDFSAFDGLSAPSLAYGNPQQNNGYGRGQPSRGGMGMQGNGQQMHMGMGMGTQGMQGMGMQGHHGGYHQQQYQPQQQYHQQYQQQAMGGNASKNISTYFAPNATGSAAGARTTGRDPFAGLGLPQ